MERNNIYVVGFDLDQTLYPKSPLIDEKIQRYLYKKIASYKNISIETARTLFNERYRNGSGMSGRQTLKDIGIHNSSEMIQDALETADIASILTPDKKVNQLLKKTLAKYKKLDLITGSNLKQTELKLHALEIPLDTFSHILTADDGSKSNGDTFKKWLLLYPNYRPEQFLYIGDRVLLDHKVPSELGIQTTLVHVSKIDKSIPCQQYTSLIEALQSL